MNAIEKLITTAEAEIGYLEKKSNKDLDSKTANAGSSNYTTAKTGNVTIQTVSVLN